MSSFDPEACSSAPAAGRMLAVLVAGVVLVVLALNGFALLRGSGMTLCSTSNALANVLDTILVRCVLEARAVTQAVTRTACV